MKTKTHQKYMKNYMKETKNLIKSKTSHIGNNDGKHTKIKLNSDNCLPLKKR